MRRAGGREGKEELHPGDLNQPATIVVVVADTFAHALHEILATLFQVSDVTLHVT